MAKSRARTRNDLASLPPHDGESGLWNVIIETPKGCRNKFKYDQTTAVFTLSGVLPVGASFPFDFGFVPSTRGDDGDPLDVLVLMEEPAFAGCLVPARLIGVIEAEQTERDGKKERNDRLIAVAEKCRMYGDVRSLGDLNEKVLEEIEHFFVSYNQVKGKIFKPLGRGGPKRAEELVKAAMKRAKKPR